jgi:2,4-dienoyl-CoA reductase-like NADH-dependent reductase (Old Yellow Enzyme family)
MSLELLFSPLTIRGLTFANRIFSTGHQTNMVEGGAPTARMTAYHEARAAGGAALIIMESARMHDTALSDGPILDLSRDDAVAGYARVAEAVKRHGTALFGQLSHPGRVNARIRDGVRHPSYSASASRDDRFGSIPRPLSIMQIEDIVVGYGRSAARMAAAGLDGVEITASHGMLPAQFLNPRVNLREDGYGGNLDGRLRFLREALEAVRAALGPGPVLGLRLSIDEKQVDGLTPDEVIEACRVLDGLPGLDYFNVTAGSMAGLGGSVHVVPPMAIETGYLASPAERLRRAVTKPVFLAGRINQPQIAEAILAAGQAEMCGMTRALIADPEMPAKAASGRLDDIRACIACNQACIGHLQAGTPISCIQHPETGREQRFGHVIPIKHRMKILVAGGGPAGMKAAAVAAQRGHEVLLCEASPRLGGQTLLAQVLPGRTEYGGLTTNLAHEVALAGVEMRTGVAVTRALVEAEAPDAVIIATGARAHLPPPDRCEGAHLLDAWSVLEGKAIVGHRVVVSDWRGDWVGMGLAEMLARNGAAVTLAVNAPVSGNALQMYLRDHWNGVLNSLGVKVVPYLGFYGADGEAAYFQHAVTQEPVVFDDIDSVVVCHGAIAATALEAELAGLEIETRIIGDCLTPRTAEEAVYEGLLAGSELGSTLLPT